MIDEIRVCSIAGNKHRALCRSLVYVIVFLAALATIGITNVQAASGTAVYGFNEGSGNTTVDASGNGNMGTLAGPSWTTAGRYGNALFFNGTDADVEAPNSSSLNPGTAATFSAWVNVLGTNTNISSVINKWSQTADDEYLFGLDPSNRLTFAWQTTGGNLWGQPSYNIVSGNAQVPLGTWTYITVVRTGPAISFYINGNLDATFSAAADANPFQNGINTLRIGGQNRGGMTRVLNGTIDEVRMYNQALTPAQIQSDMNAPIGTLSIPPSIATQPANQTVTAGQTAMFTVVAAGVAPLGYQWQKNGVNIAGATAASYATPPTTTSDNGATLIIKNTGTATLTISQVTATGSGFSISGFSLPLNVSAGQQTTITVAFLPTVVGSTSGNISIVSNAPTSLSSVSLSGTGIAATFILSISPTSLSFGDVTTGISSTSQSVIITNTANSNVAILQINLSGAGYTMTGGSAPVTLTPLQNLTLSVQFSPTVAGAVNGHLSIVSNATGSPATVPLTGTGAAPVQHSVALTWNASTSTVAGYNVYRSTVSGGSYAKINSSLVAALNYTDSTVQSGTTSYYETTAVDSSGNESVFSNQVPATIP